MILRKRYPLQLLHADASALHACGKVDRLPHPVAEQYLSARTLRCGSDRAAAWTTVDSSIGYACGSFPLMLSCCQDSCFCTAATSDKGARELGHVLIHLLDVGAGALHNKVVQGPAVVGDLQQEQTIQGIR
jgi:hypothetical protein